MFFVKMKYHNKIKKYFKTKIRVYKIMYLKFRFINSIYLTKLKLNAKINYKPYGWVNPKNNYYSYMQNYPKS